MKKKALVASILTIALCLSLIAGSTFALFTSESTVNVAVTSGKVNVTATASEPELGSRLEAGNLTETHVSKEDNTITIDKMVPGDVISFTITIHNDSNVTVKQRTVIKKVTDNGLWSGLKVTIGDTQYSGVTKITPWNPLDPGCADVEVPVVIELPVEAGNEYQEKSCTLAYTVEAVQGNADLPEEWDGSSLEAPTADPETGIYHITTAPQFVSFITNITAYGHVTISIDKDFDLGGATITTTAAQGNRMLDGVKINGNGHTISNFTIDSTVNEYYGGLFGYMPGAEDASWIKDLTVKDATIIGGKQTGAIIGGINGADSKVENCHAINCTVIGTKKVGSVVGYAADGSVDNCSATDCNVYCELNDSSEADKVVGYVNGATTSDLDDDNVNVYVGVNVFVADAATAAAALKSENEHIYLILTDDITMRIDELLAPQIAGSGEYRLGGANTEEINIDLNGHKLTLDTDYMSALGANNGDAVINVMNGSVNSTNIDVNWNTYDLLFANCTWNFENVTFDKAVSIYTGATATMKNVTINESGDNYALWITADAKAVTLDNVTINCPNGRAIAVKDQYVGSPASVTLNIKDSKITSAKKAAVLVTSTAGASINAENVDISNVAADSTNLVWIDNANPSAPVTVNGGSYIVEP